MVKQILDKGDKLIIVSQWSSMLEIIGFHLSMIKGAKFSEFSGRVPIKDRQVGDYFYCFIYQLYTFQLIDKRISIYTLYVLGYNRCLQ